MPVTDKKKVLIIDDDADMRSLLCRLFGDDYEVIAIDGPAGALDRIRAEKPSLVLLDLVMPGMNGLEFLDSASSDASRLPPIIMLTSVEDISVAEQALAKGAVEYISKQELSRLKRLVDSRLGLPQDAGQTPWKVAE